MTIKRAGLQWVAAADTLKPTVLGSSKVAVSPGALAGFLVTGIPTSAQVNVEYTFTVTAQDSFGNTVTNYLGTAQFSNAGGTALLPDPYLFTTADLGRRVFKVTFQTTGPGQSVTVVDQANPGDSGTEDGITVS